jgi:hypothetical protein
VKDKSFAWERGLHKSDLKALAELGQTPPDGPLLGLRTDGPHHKQALLEELPDKCFTIPHFNNYPAVLIILDAIELDELRELLIDAWLVQAPKRLADAYVAEHPEG